MCEIFDISYAEIEVIKELWEKNRKYHENISEYFKELCHSFNFEERMKPFSMYDSETMKITVARIGNEYVGYCISTITNGKGELDSLHVNEIHRGKGIGKKLVSKHIQWMKENKCKAIGVTVSQENESTIQFYRKLGFYPYTLYMLQK